MDLINMLTSQLGVSQDQAKGGAGLIFDMIKDKASGTDFDSIKDAIPEVSDFQNAAPKSGGLMGAVGSLTSSLSGGDSGLGGLAELAGGFSKLNLDTDMVGKFIPVVLEFVKGKGGDGVMGIVSKFLK